MTTITLDVNADQLHEWLVADLQQCYVDARKYWTNDQPYNNRLCDALLTTLEHYMTKSDYEAWLDEIQEL